MAVVIGRTTREMVYVPGIKAWRSGSAADPTTLPVQFTLLPEGEVEPLEIDWVAGAWVAGADTATASILVSGLGRGGAIQRAGPAEHNLWMRILGALEQPERIVGFLIFV